MSDFAVEVLRIDGVGDHPDADRLSLNRIRGYVAISNKTEDGKHRYEPGQLVVYVPEGAVVPDRLLQLYGYWDESKGEGILAGSRGNRVKAIKLRGILSQGLIFPVTYRMDGSALVDVEDDEFVFVSEGENVADKLGIKKYEPEIPASMSGEVTFLPQLTRAFDIENVQKYPDTFDLEDRVIATEKLHGTFCGLVFINEAFASQNLERSDLEALIPFGNGYYATAYSKGLGQKGFVFQASPENEAKNVYLRVLKELLGNSELASLIVDNVNYLGGKFSMFGEVYGKGIQDLTYGVESPRFAAFNFVDSEGNFMAAKAFWEYVGNYPFIPTVPLLFDGTYAELLADIKTYRDGKSAVDGQTLREGIVVTDVVESRDDVIGRRAVKMINPDYLTRKGGTELN